MRNSQAALQVNSAEALKRKLYLLSNCRFGRRVDFEPKDAWSSCGRKPEHICEIGVQSDQHSVLPDRKLSNPRIRFAKQARLNGGNSIMSLFTKNRRLLWREILVEKESHDARITSLLARLAAYCNAAVM